MNLTTRTASRRNLISSCEMFRTRLNEVVKKLLEETILQVKEGLFFLCYIELQRIR